MHNCGFYARYGRDLYFVSRDLTALSEQLKKYDFRLGVVEVVGSNPAGPIDENPAIPKGFAGFFRFLMSSVGSSKVTSIASFGHDLPKSGATVGATKLLRGSDGRLSTAALVSNSLASV